MHPLLQKFLNKRGIKDFSELDNTKMPDGSPTERQTFENYQVILSKNEFSIQDVKQFCQMQISTIENKWADLNLEQAKKAEFIPYHTVYRLLLAAIDSPKAAREQLEQQLNQLIR